jgi:hypothetical protein
MAAKEPRIAPDLWECRRHGGYSLFVHYHRHQLEANPAFAPWEDKLQSLAENEASSRGLRPYMSANWTDFHEHIVAPIHIAFWVGWEDVVQLKKEYLLRREAEYDQEQLQRTAGQQSSGAASIPACRPSVEEKMARWNKDFRELVSSPAA